MSQPKRIFIVGHMGAGKFIFTEALAKKLGWQIVDANPSIERYIGRQTRDILGEQGEAAFNRSQADIIAHCIRKENVVVLLEECVVSSEQCRKLLSSEFVIYLKVSIPTQLERMKHGRIPSLPVDDMKSFLEKQHHDRDAFYEEIAILVVESVGYSNDASEINKIVERDVNVTMKALGSKMNYKISHEPNPKSEDIQVLNDGISEQAKQKKGMKSLGFFAFFIRDANEKIVGGCNTCNLYGCLYIDQLWLDESLRGKSYGKQLMQKAEDLAKESGCHFMAVNTFDWEALDFYKKLGFYVEFQRKGFDKNSVFYFLRKDLI